MIWTVFNLKPIFIYSAWLPVRHGRGVRWIKLQAKANFEPVEFIPETDHGRLSIGEVVPGNVGSYENVSLVSNPVAVDSVVRTQYSRVRDSSTFDIPP